jgi:pimeloyl-ACP methyl ester carboxylesterase
VGAGEADGHRPGVSGLPAGSWRLIERDGVELACLEYGGTGPPVLLLHGLAGHAEEWAETAGWLARRSRVVALDSRGHGHSERDPPDVSQRAHVADLVFAVGRLDLAPVALIGHSLGGVTALLAAAAHPELVSALVLADAGPADDGEATIAEVEAWLASWPDSFPTREAAAEFFGGSSLAAEMWADGLERRDGRWWPRFDADVMIRTIRDTAGRSYWEEWESIQSRALVVRAGEGVIRATDARAMVARRPGTKLVEIPDAGHDVHLDRPIEWRAAVESFLAQPR